MRIYRNYLIALLTGLLVLSLSTEQAQSAGKSKEAKMIEYGRCLELAATSYVTLDSWIAVCSKYRP